MIKFIKQYFIFSKRERIGTYILLILLVVLIIIRYSISHKPIDQSAELEKFKKEIADFEASAIKDHGESKTVAELEFESLPKKHKQPIYFKFDPNVATINDWQKMGFSEKQAASILKYVSKGGKFKTKADLKKMYVISEKKYSEIEAYIQLPTRLMAKSEVNQKEIIGDSIKSKRILNELPKNIFPVELNIISKYKLTTGLNVKPELAEEIVKYRNFLRGFVSVEQLKEVEALDSITYVQIKDLVKVNPKYIKKININSDTSRDLWHPYISRGLQKNIFNYRQIHGDYKNLEDLKKLALINDEIYRKLVPYLTVE